MSLKFTMICFPLFQFQVYDDQRVLLEQRIFDIFLFQVYDEAFGCEIRGAFRGIY